MRRLGRYEIMEEVGRGGMGVVYRGVDSALGRTVAVKTVRLGEYATPQEARTLRERLLREARAAAAPPCSRPISRSTRPGASPNWRGPKSMR